MEAPRTPDATHEAPLSFEACLHDVQEKLRQADAEIPEAPAACTLDGRTWECNGDSRMELIAQLAHKVEIVSVLMTELRDVNAHAVNSSSEQRATYKTLQWLQAEYDIRSSELHAARAQFTQEALEHMATNDNRPSHAVAA